MKDCSSKKTINKIKRKMRNWGNNGNKYLVYKQLLEIKKKNVKNQCNKWLEYGKI